MSFDVLGIIAPHPPIMVEEIGGEDASRTSTSIRSMRALGDMVSRFGPETLVLISPHTIGLADAFTVTVSERLRGDLGAFRAPQVTHDTSGDPELARAIIEEAEAAGLPTVPREHYARLRSADLDHGTLVPLYFLDRDSRYPLVVISFTDLSAEAHRAFGLAIRRAAETVGRRIAVIGSGDCSHRLTPEAPAGYSPEAHTFDEHLVELTAAGDFRGMASMDPVLRSAAGECGWRSFLILGGYVEGRGLSPRVLSYEAPWGVGYLTAAFAPAEEIARLPSLTPAVGSKGGTKREGESPAVRLARTAIERCVRSETVEIEVTLDDPSLPRRAGVFVTLNTGGCLRGCIGTIQSTRDTLEEEIVYNAIQAACTDPRFPPVTEEELDVLDVCVSILHDAERVASLAELDPSTYGVIVSAGGRRGLLLPDIEGIDTAEMQVSIAMQKGCIAPGEPVVLERFQVDKHV